MLSQSVTASRSHRTASKAIGRGAELAVQPSVESPSQSVAQGEVSTRGFTHEVVIAGCHVVQIDTERHVGIEKVGLLKTDVEEIEVSSAKLR
mgnify:CR=1 FL=1